MSVKQKVFMTLLMISIFCCGCQKQKKDTKIKKENQTTAIQTQQITDPVKKEIFAMDTYMTLTAYGENAQQAVDDAATEIERIEEMVSIGKENSEIARINKEKKGSVSNETAEMLEYALALSKDSEGAFDITVYPLMQAWGFVDKTYQVPSDKVIQDTLLKIGSDKVYYDKQEQYVTLAQEDMAIDLGGIAKGYASDKVADIFLEHGVESGIVNLGGNVKTIGAKEDGSNWKVAIQSPDEQEEYIGVVEVADKVVITSGTYERYFEENGKRYHHIMDTKTGKPAENGLVSVSIITENGMMADALSTCLFVMGKEKAIHYWTQHKEEFDVIFIEENGQITITSGIKECFSTEGEVKVIE